ncbi:TolB family protein [Asticcacaulis solisilvae]|uniref:TolB family protein n=1 Tax=Asticcacaulis solisilvae TaxID=1217274 RepID=UPI003FD85138
MKRIGSAALAALMVMAAGSAQARVGIFAHSSDVGTVRQKGHALYDAKTKTYRVVGNGDDLWAGKDDFHFVHETVSGDVSIAGTVTLVSGSTDPHSKAGLMVRQDLKPDSAYADIVVHQNGHVALQYRETRGGNTYEIEALHTGPGRFQLERQGDYVFMSVADDKGVLHHAGGGFRLKLDGSYLVGLAVCSHSDTETKTVDFSDVEIAKPAALPAITAQTRVESTLETVDVTSDYRAVVYHTADHIEAPNWSADGKTFVFNSAGHIFTMPVAGGAPVQLDTQDLSHINNDHGPSPDGKWLAISDQTRGADNQSRVYVVPMSGGAPRQVTAEGPSYWHGWSPDGKTLAVVARRNGDFDIYAVPAEGGPETRLTTAPGLDDGSEYSPDGKWIYFNSVRTGNMKIWRMRPDGSQQQQVTFGADSRDWFPHVSPDGKWIAYVSFGTDVEPGDHPANRFVSIKVMPAGGGTAHVVAKLFGGQGTMNVPSWSPDSTHLAFVSYRPVP